MINIYNLNIVDILPESLKNDPEVKALADAITPEFQSIAAEIEKSMIIALIDQQPEDVVDYLAWQYKVDFYDQTLPIEKKRELVKNSPSWHMRKGTPSAVEEVVTAAFDEAFVSEWFEYDGSPYLFKITTKDAVTDQKKLDELIRAVNSVKNTRSRLEEVVIERQKDQNLYFGGIVQIHRSYTIQEGGQ